MQRYWALFAAVLLVTQSSRIFAGAFNFQEPDDWTVGDPGSTFQEWEATSEVPFAATNSPPTAISMNPTIGSAPGMNVQTPGFVAGSGGYYSFSGTYHIFTNVYNHGGSSGTPSYASGYGTRVIVQTAATTNVDLDTSVFEDSIELTQLDGSPIAGGANTDLVSVTELFRQEVETPFGPADQQELRFEFYLPAYSADFRVRFQEAVHSSFQEMRIDTLLVAESALAGDFDGDGDVDANDLADWQTSYGIDESADADGDGDSDGRDFLLWQRNYTGSPAIAASSVPEPTSLMVVIFGIIIGLNSRPLRVSK